MAELGKGYIGLFRKLQDHWIWDDKPVARGQAWVDMLLWASHRDREAPAIEGFVEIKKGEFIRTLRQMGDAWGWSKNKVKRYLDVLQKANMIRLKSGTKTTHVSICKYRTYRELVLKGGTKKGQSRDKVGTKKGHNNKLEVIKEIKKNTNSSGRVKPYPERVHDYFISIDDTLTATWKEAYPNVDIQTQLAKAKAWLISNPSKAKKDFAKFINNWLSRSMEMPGQTVYAEPTTPKVNNYVCYQCETMVQSEKNINDVRCTKCDERSLCLPYELPYMKNHNG